MHKICTEKNHDRAAKLEIDEDDRRGRCSESEKVGVRVGGTILLPSLDPDPQTAHHHVSKGTVHPR